ncbi:DUF6247 family protein [Actinosynnema sp. NPDC023587]|uniref:DUF6247 family protein n=1 Tax=Actinosynnema sp. NPDC023587 TaxID=3154695 RepID=UPI0033DF9EAF
MGKWRHIAYRELRDPGSHHRMPAKTEQTQHRGTNPTAVTLEETKALLRGRQAQ